ncbi:hypothetical protein SAMN05443665_101770 [Actinomadura meyerae]|uniref:Uncharacterized protein n=1 Tax=Actinomadura meyerae TaxID=240840 RepID=A0A239KAR4_9ACTN|nr:hypothetical protein [Actinomadura meyerae]SNT14729.1 hypothetical protein SAMN05443665_101770 [Actinomadura meyerae]
MPPNPAPSARQILTRAADILNAQGLAQHQDYEPVPPLPPQDSPVSPPAALALAAGVDMHSPNAYNPTGAHAQAVLILGRHILGTGPHTATPNLALDELTDWNDEPGQTVEHLAKRVRDAAENGELDPVDLHASVTGYARAVRCAFADARIDLDPTWEQGCTPPIARLFIDDRRSPEGFRAVVEWDERGWAAGWHENTLGGSVTHDRVWLGVGVAPAPGVVADAAARWLTAPGGFTEMQSATGCEQRQLAGLLDRAAASTGQDRTP